MLDVAEVREVVCSSVALQAAEVGAVSAHLRVLEQHHNDFGGVRVALHMIWFCRHAAEMAEGGAHSLALLQVGALVAEVDADAYLAV